MISPAFQFYPKDWLTDINVILMTPTQRGGYIQLLAHLWLTENLQLPLTSLPQLSGLGDADLNVVKKCFETEGEFVTHKRLRIESQKQESFRNSKSAAGRKGMKSRYSKQKNTPNTVNNVLVTESNSPVPSLHSPVPSLHSPVPSLHSSESSSYEEGAKLESLKELKIISSVTETYSTPPVPESPPKQRIDKRNPEINKMLEALKLTIGIESFADSRFERNIAKHCLTLIGKIGTEEFRRRLEIIANDSFKRKNSNRIVYVYNEIKGFIEPKSSIVTI